MFGCLTSYFQVVIVHRYLYSGLLLLFFLFARIDPAATQTVQEYIQADSLRVGDHFEFAITLSRGDEYDDIIFPDSTHFGDMFEIRDQRQFKVSSYKDSVRYRLQFFGTADTVLPSLPVVLVQNSDTTLLHTDPIPVHFRTLLSGEDDQLRPFKPIFDFAAAWWPWILAVLLLALAAYVIYRYYVRRKTEAEAEPKPEFRPEPFRDPLNELQKTLAMLKKTNPKSEEEYDEFYIRLGDAIREYFEQLYRIPALESTSGEIIRQLESRAIDEDLVKDTKAVLQEADMVKFANFTPTAGQAQTALEKGYNFLQRAREVDGPRIEHMRRRHLSRVEKEKQQFYNEQQPELQEER